MGVHPLHLAGVQVIDSAPDSKRVGDDRVGVGGAQVHGGQPLHHVVGDLDSRLDPKPQRRLVGDARAVGVRDRHAAFHREFFDLLGRPVHQHHLDVEGAEHRQIEQNVPEIPGRNHVAVDFNHEDFFAKPGDVLENTAEVGDFHGRYDPSKEEQIRPKRKAETEAKVFYSSSFFRFIRPFPGMNRSLI